MPSWGGMKMTLRRRGSFSLWSRPGTGRLRGHLCQHGGVVGGAEVADEHEGDGVGLVEQELELVGPVGRVDGDEDGADLGGGELGGDPFRVVGGPDGDVVTLVDSESHQSPGDPVAPGPELVPGVAKVPVHVDEGVAVAEPVRLAVQKVSDGHFEVGGAGHSCTPSVSSKQI